MLKYLGAAFDIPESINGLISLKELCIRGTPVKELPLSTSSLPCLTDFLAGGCRFLKQVPSSVGGLHFLLELELDYTPLYQKRLVTCALLENFG
ncbi:unnamed protein product [Brassica rapa]|uniref:FBD domain-containing protein n=1 Tax=Brassica campestris TaxID=3711 RepID=A0A3P6CTU1_BRACM|nr:unnamed protein product [Brassica rapa]VDD13865.1 unnamed protein product [Brassica rapa]